MGGVVTATFDMKGGVTSMSDHTGVYLDLVTGEVTTRKPSRAKVLVRPGDPIPDAVQAVIKDTEAERPKAAEAPASNTSDADADDKRRRRRA